LVREQDAAALGGIRVKQSSLYSDVGQASLLSLAAFTTFVVFQGAVLFRREVRDVSNPPSSLVRDFALVDGGRRGVFACSVASSVSGPAHVEIGGIYDLTTEPPALVHRFRGLDPHSVCCAVRRAFLSTWSGEIYAYDLALAGREPVLLGKHVHPYVQALECSDDASIVVAAAARVAMAWDAEARRLLWRRDDLEITSCCFLPGGQRLFAGLNTGHIVELDPRSGTEIDRLAQHEGHVASISIAPQGDCLASLDWHGSLLVTELRSDGLRASNVRWSKRCSNSAMRARFSSDGKTLAIEHASPADDLGLFCARSGRRLRGLSCTDGVIAGLKMSSSGTVYAWEGCDIVAWNPGQTIELRRFTPARDWGPFDRPRHGLSCGRATSTLPRDKP
jgi:hypothetical protein